MNIRKFTPAADKKVMILMAGLMWCGVGIMLIHYAVTWLSQSKGSEQLYFYAAGFLAAMPIHHFGFLRLVKKNLKRLLPMTEKKCVFSFMTWKSYIIVVFMISLGITLRHSSLPKKYLSILYNGIGGGLFLSGISYLRNFVKLLVPARRSSVPGIS